MYKLVDGVYDYMPLESYSLHQLGNKLLGTFQSHGFMRVDTPTLEKYELFEVTKQTAQASKKLFKLIDSDGSILVMRPDMTTPIARLVTTKINSPSRNKLCYLANSFCYSMRGSDIREFTQAGVEVYCPKSVYADADNIAMAVQALIDSGLTDFQIEVGHVGYLKGLLQQLKLAERDELELLELINAKDSLGMEMMMQKCTANKSAYQAILAAPMLFGGNEVLNSAIEGIENKTSINAISELKDIDTILRALGLEKYISYDLSLVNGFSYYTGVVFKGISKHFGASILSGGRYDKLCDGFNKSLDATGFAIGVNNLLVAVRRERGFYMDMPKTEIIIGGASTQAKVIDVFTKAQMAKGLIVENSYICERAEFTEYLGGRRGVFFDKKGKMTEVNNG